MVQSLPDQADQMSALDINRCDALVFIKETHYWSSVAATLALTTSWTGSGATS